ncbi:MFS transporter [Cellulomonas fengjieae]|uniref:MFS transporter n=1 Tax=Cellulomonas fengjieae TaxID=2819978 RepID=A0ABS3SH85_9CELL|nr:MFS transporter [Cellulomonas fengjieae]MBO3085007.1 MFS transporter [Cellulomonas fengjieae]QVI66396.1 MFS transporter [Cellulomonas fengjieae]
MTATLSETARRARVAASSGFAAQGFVYATLLTNLNRFKDRYGVDDGQITLVVLGVCVMAALGTLVADRVARTESGSRAVLGVGLLVIAAAVVVASVAPGFGVLVAGFLVFGVGMGMVDAGTNMQAVAIQHEYGRSLLTGFYASWSVGGIIGAVLVAVTAGRVPDEPVAVATLTGALVAGAASVLVLASGWRGATVAVRADGVARPDEALAFPAADGSKPLVPWGAVVLLGLGVVAFYVADTAISTWSTIYLDDVMLASASFAPLGYAAYLTTTLGSRLAGDPLVRRWGRVVVLRGGALVGAAGLVLVVAAPGQWAALAGFAVAGAGLGVIAPLCFSAAGDVAPGHADAVVARLNVFNYVGAVLGGVLVGAIGSTSSLGLGFIVPIVLVVAVAVLAGRFGVARRVGTPATAGSGAGG